jgi:Holliday junction resolvase RusA-like endonuclease
MNDIIFAARLPLATSVNQLHAHNAWTGGNRLTPAALAYIDQVLHLLNYYPRAENKAQFAPYKITHLDMERIKKIRELKLNKSKAKAVLAQHRLYRMDMDCVFDRDHSDLDNRWKLCQDTITSWIGFNDRRVIETHGRKMVDKSVSPHAEVVIRETTCDWGIGSLLESVERELALPEFYEVRT